MLNTIGEEGNGRARHKIHLPRKNSEPRLWFLLRAKSSVLNTIGEEGNGRARHKIHLPRKNSEPSLWFLLRAKSSVLNTIGEEGNGRARHKIHLPRKNSEPSLWFLLRLKSSIRCRSYSCIRLNPQRCEDYPVIECLFIVSGTNHTPTYLSPPVCLKTD